jgi:serine/threonine-protein kinase
MGARVLPLQPPRERPLDHHPGDLIDNRYRIVSEIAEGGMGRVFLAEHRLIHRRFAIKFLHRELAADGGMVERFMNEALAAGTLGHPNIVEATDMGMTPDGVPYIVFEYLEGTLLTEEIYRLDGIPPRRTVRIALQIASALDAAHHAGIVHLDLKCDNVFLIRRQDHIDHVKVLDFGIAKFMGRDVGGAPGVQIGTPEFMAPEQFMTPDAVDHRADVYALGVLVYEMMAARRPHTADDHDTLMWRIVREPPPPLGVHGVPGRLEWLLFERLLCKDPARRIASMRVLADELEDILAGMGRGSGPMVALRRLTLPPEPTLTVNAKPLAVGTPVPPGMVAVEAESVDVDVDADDDDDDGDVEITVDVEDHRGTREVSLAAARVWLAQLAAR